MPGIWGVISDDELAQDFNLSESFHREPGVKYLQDTLKLTKSWLGRLSVDKFQNDKLFKKNGDLIICTDGVLFNSDILCERSGVITLDECIMKLFQEYNWEFVKDLRGNFAGFIYSESENKILIFTDHLALKPVYYHFDANTNTLLFASELKPILEGMKRLNVIPTLDMKGVYCLLSLGFMLADTTLVQEIKKLPPGSILLYDKGEINIKYYYEASSTPYIDEDEESIIKELDRLFTEVIRLEYEKDREYGYSHLATLSGGLDSRTAVAYAKECGYDNITCFTFSESNDLEELIAKEICHDNNFEFLFFALDNGNYLKKYIDEIVSANSGLTLYYGSAHLYNFLKYLCLDNHGLIHTGNVGEILKGVTLFSNRHEKVNVSISLFKKICYSDKLLHKLLQYIKKEDIVYENDELFVFYQRGLNGVPNGFRMIEQFTEFSSPFLNVDFLDYTLKIPPQKRYKEAIYLKWIQKYTPSFVKYKWSNYGVSPRYPRGIIRLFSFLIGISNKIIGKQSPMEKIENWLNKNPDLQNKFNTIYEEKVHLIQGNSELLKDCEYLFNKGTLSEKTQVITLLLAIDELSIHLN